MKYQGFHVGWKTWLKLFFTRSFVCYDDTFKRDYSVRLTCKKANGAIYVLKEEIVR